MSYVADRYLSWPEIQAWCEALTTRFPGVVRVAVLGHSREGRPLYIISLGSGPGFWLDGGTHATEWTGVMSALYSLETWLGDDAFRLWLQTHSLFVLPCLSPDGYAYTFDTGAYVRSSLRPGSEGRHRLGWEEFDVDDDGVVRYLRFRHPAGAFVQDPEVPLCMRPRTLDDSADDAYVVLAEGRFVGDESWRDAPLEYGLDLNRNFPGAWAPFAMFGMDGGQYALSEPESRVVVDALCARSQVSVAVTNHTYTGCLLTQPYRDPSPLGTADIETMHLLASQATAGTGWRVFRTFPEFSYDPKKPIVGVWSDTMATLFGVAGYTLELWDPWTDAGVEVKDPAKFFASPDPAGLRRFIQKASEEPGARPWTAFNHPQLGPVEIGGIDTLRTLSNPPERLLRETCERAFKIHDRARRALPSLHVRAVREGESLTVILENHGFFGTAGLRRTTELGIDPGIRLEIVGDRRSGEAVTMVPALSGWGATRATDAKNVLSPGFGEPSRALRHFVVRGPVTVRWWSLRAGSGEFET